MGLWWEEPFDLVWLLAKVRVGRVSGGLGLVVCGTQFCGAVYNWMVNYCCSGLDSHYGLWYYLYC